MRIEIKDIFPAEDRDIIYRYIDLLNRILRENDCVIFMARKAICFYKALQQNGYIEPNRKGNLQEGKVSERGWLDAGQQILSTRMLTFNMLEDLQDERLNGIALVDDVVVTGQTLLTYHGLLNGKNIAHKVYALASENMDGKKKSKLIEFDEVIDKIEVRRLYRLAREITSYIEISMVPYNIDTPIYEIGFRDEEECLLFLNSLPITDVTTALQKKHGMHCSMLPFSKEDIIRSNSLSEGIMLEFAKIRFYYRLGDSSVLAVPFVLFEITDKVKAQDDLSTIKTGLDLVKFATRDDEEQQAVNVHKILFHYYSDLLLVGFLKEKGLFDSERVIKIHSNQRFTFGTAKDLYGVSDDSFKRVNYVAKGYQRAELQEYTDILYKDILSGVNSANSDLVLKPEITYQVFTLKSMRKSIERWKGDVDDIKLSAALDIINDSGILVPTIIYQKESNALYGQVLRAYRHGERSGDTKNELSYFAYMLQEYLRTSYDPAMKKTVSHRVVSGKTIGRIEATKLSVLLFKQMTGRADLPFNEKGVLGDICFSFNGPVCATSKYCVNTRSEEYLLTCLTTCTDAGKYPDYPYLRKIEKGWLYGIVHGIETPEDKNVASTINGFARNYAKIIPCAKRTIDSLTSKNRNFLVRNTDDYLTLRAIGQANKHRASALVAEIEIFISQIRKKVGEQEYLPESFEDYYSAVYPVYPKDYKRMQYPALRALAEGMWKYACFSNAEDLITKINEKIDDDLIESTHMDYYANSGIDESRAYKRVMESAGNLLVELVFATKVLCDKANKELDGKRFFVPETLENQFNQFDQASDEGTINDAHGRLALKVFKQKESEVCDELSVIKTNHYRYIHNLLLKANSIRRQYNALGIYAKDGFEANKSVSEYFILISRSNPRRHNFESDNTQDKNAIFDIARSSSELLDLTPRWMLYSTDTHKARHALLMPLCKGTPCFEAADKVFRCFGSDIAIFHVADQKQYELYVPSSPMVVGCFSLDNDYFPIANDLKNALKYYEQDTAGELLFTFCDSMPEMFYGSGRDYSSFEPRRDQLTGDTGESIQIFQRKGSITMVQSETTPENKGAGGDTHITFTGPTVINAPEGDLLHRSSKTTGNQSPATAGSNSSIHTGAINVNTKELIELLEKFLESSEVSDISEDERQELQGIVGSYKEGTQSSKDSAGKRLSEWIRNTASATTLINFAITTVPKIKTLLESMLTAGVDTGVTSVP
jgi:hypothetical protein